MSRLHHISAMHRLAARRCSGIFPSYSHARRGASALRLPACRAGQQCVSPPSCRPGPRSSRLGQCFPEAEQGGQGPPLVLSCCCFLSWRLRRHQFENRDVRLVCHQRLGVGDHAPRTPGRACRGGSRAWPGKILLSCQWLIIKHHLQARQQGKSQRFESALATVTKIANKSTRHCPC